LDKPKYTRIILKLSGEALLGSRTHGIDPKIIHSVARQIKEVYDLGVDIGIVIGGGNFFRGIEEEDDNFLDRSTADYMGMLATVMNTLALQSSIEKYGIDTRIQSSIAIHSVAEEFIKRRAIRHFEKKRIVIFGGGTGNPYFSTDTAAVLRCMETKSQIVFKATKVDGIYNKDPKKFSDAVKYDTITYDEFISHDLKVMDMTAITLCRENKLPLLVFNLFSEGNIKKAVLGEKVGTVVKE
jgi:uridylate kinase